MKSAIVFGATGLVGRHLVQHLIDHQAYKTIYVVVRSAYQTNSSKVRILKSDYTNIAKDLTGIQADEAYICLGTTIKKAGSVKAMERIDRDFPIEAAISVKENGANRLAVVSSIGAKSTSNNYYLRIKGEMEQALIETKFQQLAIVRPSLILGERNEKRFGETFGKIVMKAFSVFLVGNLRKYRAIHANTIAKSMVNILNSDTSTTIFESDQLKELGQ